MTKAHDPSETASSVPLCECRQGCNCEDSPGPALVEITRRGRTMRVCTFCHLSGDTTLRVLPEALPHPNVYMEYDAFGAISFLKEIEEAVTREERRRFGSGGE
jgi:hypothetical protein